MALQSSKESVKIWEKGQKCEIHCLYNKQPQWVKGEVIGIFDDDDGKWVKVKYGNKRTEVLCDSEDIRILSEEKEQDDHGWNIGSQCELYSRDTGKWMEGEVINLFNDDLGRYLRVQYGQNHRVQDVHAKHVAHDLRARGTSHLAVTLDEFKKLKDATTKTAIEKVLKRIFANSEKFVFEDGGDSLVFDGEVDITSPMLHIYKSRQSNNILMQQLQAHLQTSVAQKATIRVHCERTIHQITKQWNT